MHIHYIPRRTKGATMSERITNKDLENVLSRINHIVGAKQEPWSKDSDGKYRANVGTYVLDYAYGGVRLSQLTSEGGGERDITGRGTKKETYYRMHAFIQGLEAHK